MTFKRYIYRNGKKYGPYYYHNTKINGKVISNYVGTEEDRIQTKKKHNVKIAIIVISVIAIFLFIYVASFLKLFPTGRQIDTPSITATAPEPNQVDFSYTEQVKPIEDKPVEEPQYKINTVQSPVIVNNPVQWKKEISLETEGPIKISIPKESENIAVYKINVNGDREKLSEPQIKITARASSEIITDKSQIQESKIVSFFKKIFNFLTGKVINIQESQTAKEITINEKEKQYEIEYSTLAPYTIETKIERGKSIKLINPSEIDYKDVLISSNIEELRISNPSSISLYSIEKNQVMNYENIEDKNDDGIYDYIEFISPDSSNQTFEIIVITKAEHLDENRTFISDIYEQVKEIDNIWSETISNGEYVRVTFEQNLTSTNDITIFPRITEGNPKIEIYEKDKNNLIAEFTGLNSDIYNKVYLTNLQGEQDTFDLKIIGGNVEFDHIIDPVANPNPPTGGSILRSQTCLMENSSATPFNYVLNCQGVYPSTCGTSTDKIGCNDGFYVEQSITTTNNRYSGMLTSVFNSSINNCININQVFLCYEWWRSGSGTVSNCVVQVDANGGTSYRNVSITCPGTTANPLMTCTNVTASEVWNCNNFFGLSGTRALARNQIYKTAGNVQRFLRTDALFFNVTYTADTQGPSISNPNTNTSLINQNEFFCLNATAIDISGVSSIRAEVYNTTHWLNYTMNDTGAICGGLAGDNIYGVSIQGSSIGLWNYSKVYANDSFNNWNSYDFSDLIINVSPIITNTAPKWQTNSTNSTLAGTEIKHDINWTDDTALSGYIFSFANGSATFVNDSWVAMTGTLNWSNVTKIVNSTVGSTIQWKVYANDSSNALNVTDTFSYLTTATNQPPQIIYVQQPLLAVPLESTFRTINFEVHISDANGADDIDDNSIRVDFSKLGDLTRSGTCKREKDLLNPTTANYTCFVDMFYYDSPGFWNISIRAGDFLGDSGINDTNLFRYQELKAIVINSPSGALTWPTLKTGDASVLSNNDPLVINNTGNFVGPIYVTATNLTGETNPVEFISASSFNAGPTSGSECGATQLQNSLTQVLGSNLIIGPTAQEEIYFCIASVPQISSQNYSTSSSSSWTISI